MKRTLFGLVGAVAVTMVGSAAAATVIPTTHGASELVIRHAQLGCHNWEQAGVDAGTAYTLTMHVGHALTIVNRDVADHMLVQTSGPTTMAPMLLGHLGSASAAADSSATAITFFAPGTYTFRTEEVAHRPLMLDMIGEVPDHSLTLKVIVVSEYE